MGKSNKDLSYYFASTNLVNRPECELMILCLKQFLDNNSTTAIQSHIDQCPINWSHFIEFVSKQGVVLPVAHVLKFFQIKSIPADTDKQLHEIQQFYVQRNRSLVNESIRIFTILKKNDLAGIPYKGFFLAKQFYGNTIQRTSVDIDFAMDINQFQQVKEVMLELGYEEFKSNIDMDAIEQSRAYYLDYPFVLKKNGKIVCNVEFHWTPSHHILNIPIQFDEFMDQTEVINFGRHQLQTFNKVHQALFAVIHHANVDCWGKFKHLLDFALIVRNLDESEIEKLENLCKKYKIYNSYQVGKSMLNLIFDHELKSTKTPSDNWVLDLMNGTLKGNWSENKRKFIYFLQSRDNFIGKLKSTYSIVKYQLFIKPKLDLMEDEV